MDINNKKEIINLNKGDFINFLENDTNGIILEVLDDAGIAYLKQYSDVESRISSILGCSKYVNKLFYNNSFLDLFLNTDISNYYLSLSVLDDNVCDLIIKRCIELNKDIDFIGTLVSYFNKDYLLKLVDRFDYPNDLVYEIFKKRTDLVGAKIIEKFNIDLLSHDISIGKIISLGKKLSFNDMAKRNGVNAYDSNASSFYLSSDLLNKNVAEHLWNDLNLYEYRFLVNDANYCGDSSVLNKYAKMKEEEFILSNNYLEPYSEIINLIKKISVLDSNSDEYYDIFRALNKKMNVLNNPDLSYSLINGKFDDIINFVNKTVNEKKSDCIIDYHFEENYYNIMYDLRELLDFYYGGNMTIPEDRLYLYQQIVNIDHLSSEEKMQLHNTLKNYNMMELFYDDMAFARKMVREALKDYAMVKDDLVKFKDEKMSNEYGVDVYNIGDNSFFALVKSHIKEEDKLPVGHSYSLVGNGCISIFGHLEDSDTFVYDADDLNADQIVHIFPKDSYTLFQPFAYTDRATTRVEQLVMPDEMLYEGKFYNEVLILEQGKEKTDIDSRIPKLKRIALYCVDQISAKDVEIAKLHGIGIMFVDSKKYNKGVEMPSDIYRHLGREDYYTYLGYGSLNAIEKHRKNR